MSCGPAWLKAARAQCLNNLKQIGQAFHSHHSLYKFFPSGGKEIHYSPPSPPLYSEGLTGVPLIAPNQKAGWAFQILPFLEGDNAWKAGAVVAIATPNPVFFCPSRRGPQTLVLNPREEGYVRTDSGSLICFRQRIAQLSAA